MSRSAIETLEEFIEGRAAPYLEALAEVVVVVFFGILPFIVAVIRYNVVNNVSDVFEYTTTFNDSFSGGQLYLYAFSLFGTLMWLSFFNWTIPFYKSRILIAAIVIVVGLLIVAMGGIDPTFSTIKNKSVVKLSHYCYAICIILYLLLLLISKAEPPSVNETTESEARSLMARARKEIGND
ncbi:hypothetical protein [Bradyrhizobium sp. NP1]|uniref:hypothetical protein n=1 Tax=Bradyrhizobium sp. NP1 TaxID=3049772 RepID=UPI0025A61D47|nr:hypothetical protein [Bradyrhizobium sp. NP1]WJR79645.1 hypothetical protein QOU61_07685 [Bradyrhizobium sp. NP1]